MLADDDVDECVGELRGRALAGDEDAVVNGPDDLLDGEVDVEAGIECAAGDRAFEGQPVVATLPAEMLEAQPGGECGVVLSLRGECAEDRAGVGLGQEAGDLAGVGTQILPKVRGV
nr:hypothetical protein [Nonomuraea diastatica]